MKLDIPIPNIEMSSDLDETMFSIGDPSIVFDILRSKMYSNPILAICREITCNARDAHREVKTPDLPIHIYLPNTIEPYYKVKDFGPGISPQRIADIYTKYGCSTKREDDTLTGSFGLGAKSGWAYSDSFSISTNVDGIAYHYTAFIDETRVGKLVLNHQAPTKLPNGTEIQIPVLPQNFNDFAIYTEQACRWWDVKPIIKGNAIEWKTFKNILEGDKWAITVSSNHWDYSRHARMIIDGIEYPLDIDALRKYASSKLIDACRGDFVMTFGIGELSLSASREQIYLDSRTQKVIRARLETIKNKIKKRVADKIESFPDLWQAKLYYHKELNSSFNNIEFLGPLTWRNIVLQEDYSNSKCRVYVFGKNNPRYGSHRNPNKIRRTIQRSLDFSEGTELYVNDLTLKELTARHVKKAFDNDPNLIALQVVVPNDKISIQDLNDLWHLDLMAPKMLSSICKASARSYTPSASRVILFKFHNGAFSQVSYASSEEDANDKVLCLLHRGINTRSAYLKTGQVLTDRVLQNLCREYPNHSFYGVDHETSAKRLEDDFADMELVDDFLNDTVLDTITHNYVEMKWIAGHCNGVDTFWLDRYKDIVHLIKDKQSIFLSRMEQHKAVQKLSANCELLALYELVKGEISTALLDQYLKEHPQYDLSKIDAEYEERYPLLPYVDQYQWRKSIPHLAQYINLIDAQPKGTP
jgi:hypothetical protein